MTIEDKSMIRALELKLDVSNELLKIKASELKEARKKYSRQQIQAFADSLRWWGVAITPTLMAKYIEAFLNKQDKEK